MRKQKTTKKRSAKKRKAPRTSSARSSAPDQYMENLDFPPNPDEPDERGLGGKYRDRGPTPRAVRPFDVERRPDRH